MASPPLPFNRILLRSREGLEVFTLPSERDEESSISKRETRKFLFKGSSSFHQILPNGSAAFVHKPEVGIFRVNLGDSATDSDVPFLENTARVQIMAISPQGTFVLTWERAQEGDAPNLKVWNSETGAFVIGFRQKALKRDSWPYVQWTNNESFAFLLGTNEVRVYPGKFPESANTRFVDKMQIPGITSLSLPSNAELQGKLLFTSFCPGDKNKPAKAALYEYPAAEKTSGPYPPILSKSLYQAEEMSVSWNPKGDAALVKLQTSVDTSGQSYYGSTSLFLMSAQDKDTVAVPLPQEGPVHDVGWMPNPSKPACFAVAAGKMPSMTSLHNGADGTASFLFGNAHRNTIAWAPHGRFLCLAGFGNLAGGMTFWDRNKQKQIPPANPVTASCTVGYGWSPDSRLVFVSTTSPRMNVDNGVHIYRYNGDKMTNLPWDNNDYVPNRLLQAEFVPAKSIEYPDRPQSPQLKDVNTPSAAGAPAAAKPGGRYVPPSQRAKAGRGGSSLADRMRAEREGGSVAAGKVKGKPKVTGATGKVVVGMAPVEQKSKSALRREKAKKKKEEEAARQALEEKVLAEAKAAEPAQPEQAAVDPEKRAKKINKILRQIDELKQRDQSSLNEDQKKKIESEASLREELAKLGIQ
ncbi:unnamed protein product [Cylindrotheca closterium]|uniref:Translation initiation factor beta propellor-like domain-containing protein n=1 Tax=Cylindrotheca closterium TaxID=2856 RepID=A0AAD2CTA6_9STRA|nr:unnamed protein product [Cylindrotheca closterium]